MKRYTVLSYIVNNYEILHEIGELDPEAEYIMVTDNKMLTSQTWQVVYDADLEGKSVFDKCYLIRFNSFKYAHTDICVRIDGSMRLKHSLKPLIDMFEAGAYDACLMPHPFHDNFIQEYDLWVKLRGYPRKQAQRCIQSMRSRGYDFDYKGLFQGGFTILRNKELTRQIERQTYDYLRELGQDGIIERIDQIPLSYILNTHFSHMKVLPISEQLLRSYYIQMYEHYSIYPNTNAFYNPHQPDVHYMFNVPVVCQYLLPPANSVITYEQDMQAEIRSLCKLHRHKDAIIRKYERKLRCTRAILIVISVMLLSVCVVYAIL